MRTILVVDDEPVVLACVASTLELSGFAVLRAAAPGEALRIGSSCGRPIDLMVCDVLMPGMAGPRLAAEFHALHPETRCLFMAGLPDHPEVREHILAHGLAFLAKPFLPDVLVAKVRELLAPLPQMP